MFGKTHGSAVAQTTLMPAVRRRQPSKLRWLWCWIRACVRYLCNPVEGIALIRFIRLLSIALASGDIAAMIGFVMDDLLVFFPPLTPLAPYFIGNDALLPANAILAAVGIIGMLLFRGFHAFKTIREYQRRYYQ